MWLVGVDRLVAEGALSAAFPLHDVSALVLDIIRQCCAGCSGGGRGGRGSWTELQTGGAALPPDVLHPVQVLQQYWARWAVWYKYQPLDHVRHYLGEKVAIYFAWLGEACLVVAVCRVALHATGFYTAFLLPAALVGLLVFLYGVATLDHNSVAREVCNGSVGKSVDLVLDFRLFHCSVLPQCFHVPAVRQVRGVASPPGLSLHPPCLPL